MYSYVLKLCTTKPGVTWTQFYTCNLKSVTENKVAGTVLEDIWG
jgi:hypothetical protein